MIVGTRRSSAARLVLTITGEEGGAVTTWIPRPDRGQPGPDRSGPGPVTPGSLLSSDETAPDDATPDSIAGWKAVAEGLLSVECCAFHRNVAISARYAWLYGLLPTSLKWAGMAAIASHHVRVALFPLRLDADRTGYVDITRSLGRRRLLLQDVDAIRSTNNGIFDDIFWVHLAYVTGEGGIDRLRALLRAESRYAPVLAAFEDIDRGRRVLEDGTASAAERQAAEELVWAGNVQVLEHEQRALVQPSFDRLSCTFARLVSLGSATTFGVRGARQEVACFTSFYVYSLTRGMPRVVRARAWPRITRFDDRWWWIETSVVPHFRALDGDRGLIDASLRRIIDGARILESMPCVLPLVSTVAGPRRAATKRADDR
jgi:hypothetical protein